MAASLSSFCNNLFNYFLHPALGPYMDGILRNHMVMPNGTLRDTYVYSIIASEWPAVKAQLAFLKYQRYLMD